MKRQISKEDFYRNGGMSNRNLFRKMRGSSWPYWRTC